VDGPTEAIIKETAEYPLSVSEAQRKFEMISRLGETAMGLDAQIAEIYATLETWGTFLPPKGYQVLVSPRTDFSEIPIELQRRIHEGTRSSYVAIERGSKEYLQELVHGEIGQVAFAGQLIATDQEKRQIWVYKRGHSVRALYDAHTKLTLAHERYVEDQYPIRASGA